MSVTELLGGELEQNPRAFIVSSLAGGSGAGTFLDVADILSIQSGSSDSTVGILYTADIFTNDKSIIGVEGVEGNSLAALSELLSGYWSEDERHLSLFRSQGLASGSITRGGISFPFLVGGTNASGVTLGSAIEVYRSIGESLALITVSPDVQEKFTRFLMTNWASAGLSNTDLLGLQGPMEMPATSALGYSRIGLGRDRFKDYALRRLARSAVEFLATGYLAKESSGDLRLTPVEALESIVEKNKLVFLEACELYERDEHNQIIDALAPKETDSLWSSVNATIAERQNTAKEADVNTWLRRFQGTAELLASDFATSFDSALNASTAEWASVAPDRLLNVVNDYCARFGIAVVLELLAYTKAELESVANQLIAESGKLETVAGNWLGRVGQLGIPTSDLIGPNHPKMANVIQNVTSPWYYGSLAKIRQRASAVMIEFARDIVAPLAAALRVAQSNFEADTAGRAGDPPEFMHWPKDDLIPDWIRPSEVEFLLDDVDKYPETFVHLVAAMTTREELRTGQQPMEIAREKVIRGGFQARSVTPIDFAIRKDLQGVKAEDAGSWRPTIISGQGGPIRIIAEFHVDDIVQRAEEWTQQPGVFREYLEESLSGFLSERDAKGNLIVDHDQRLQTFKTTFTAALSSSTPLINVDTNLYSITHPNALDHARVIEPLPFPEGHPARQMAEEILTKGTKRDGGGAEPDGSDFTSTNAGVGSVGIISYFAQPVHPVVFKSVTQPIDAKLQEGKSDFWQWRRTRQLSEFIPISSSARRAMIRGWFTARAMGMLDTADLKMPIRILSSSSEWLAFPHAPLGGFIDSTALPLAVVLESMPLAWIGWAVGRTGEVEAYRRLLHLGLTDPSSMTAMGGDGAGSKLSVFSYEILNDELSEWITSGNVLPKSLPIMKGDTHEEREASMREIFATMAETLETSFKPGDLSATGLLHARRGIDLVPEVVSEIRRVGEARYVANEPPVY